MKAAKITWRILLLTAALTLAMGCAALAENESPTPSVDYNAVMLFGEDYSFTVTPDDGVEYNLRIERWHEWDQNKWLTDTENNDQNRKWTGAHTFTFGASQFQPGIYTIRIWANINAAGFSTSYREYDFVCAEDPISDGISLTLNDHPLVNTPVHITVNAPGADEIRLYNQDGKLDWRAGNHFEYDTGVPNGDRFYYARAKINGTWYISDVKEIHWIEYEQCAQAPVTVDRQVARGGMFTVTIGETPNANVFHLHIVEKSDPKHELYFQKFSVPGSYLIPSAKLPAGQYYVYVSNGGPGYGWIDLGPQDDDVLTVTQASAGLHLSKTQVEVGENLAISVYDPGAERIRVTDGYRWMDENGWDGDSWYTIDMHWGNVPDHVTIRAEGMHGGKWQLINEIPVEIVASNGNMPAPAVDIRSAYAPGVDVGFNVSMPAFATSCEITVIRTDNDNTIMRKESRGNTNMHFNIPAKNLEAEKIYVARILVRGYGYRCFEGDFPFAVTNSSLTQGITLEVPQELHMGQHVDVKVFADGADEVMVWSSAFGKRNLNRGDGYDQKEGCFKAGFEINIDSGDTGEQTVQFYAMAKTNGQWNRMTALQTVTVAANHGPADSPTFTISKTQRKRGEMLLANVNPISQQGGEYHVNIFDMNDNWAADFCGGESGEIYVSTANLAPGQYRIHAYVRVMDYLVGHSEEDLFFTVTDEPSDGMGNLYVTHTQLETYQCPLFSLYAKGADEVAVCIARDSNDIAADRNYWDGKGNLSDNRFIHWRWFDHPGTYYAYMAARFGNEWRVVGNVTEINVTASKGESPVPSVDYSPVMLLGEDYFFTVTPDAGVEYNLRIERRDEWDQNKWLTDTENNDQNRNWTGEHTFTFSSSQFRSGDYAIRIWSGRHDVGFAASYKEYNFICSKDLLGESISLMLNESPLVNTPLQITVNAPGAKEIILYNQRGDIARASKDRLDIKRDVPNDDTCYYARALVNGQWYISDVKEIHWIEYEQCAQAPVTVDRQVARGGMFTVTIGETPNANVFHLHIVEKSDPKHELYFQKFSVPGSYLIPSAKLPAGQYYVYVSNGGPGYGWIDLGPQDDDVLTVTQASAGLHLSKTQVEVGENLAISVYDPGAERIRVTDGYRWMDENGWDGDSWYTIDMHWGNVPDHVTIRAEGMHGGKWQLINEIPVEIVASNGNMPAPDVTVMNAYDVGLDVDFKVIAPDYATFFDVEVYKADGHDTILRRDWVQNTDKPFKIPANTLEAGQTYAVRTLVRGFGYRCYEGEKLFVIAAPYDKNLNISVDGSYENRSIKVNVGYTVKASAKNATAIRVYNGQGWRYYLGSSMEEVWCESHKGLRIFYVQAYYGQVDSDRYHQGDMDYMRNLAWNLESMSNMIRIDFTAIGQAPKPEYVLDSRIVYRGDQLVLTLQNMDERQTYKAHVWRELNGSDLWYEPNYHPVGNTIRVETDYIEPGVVLVWVDAEGREDYENNSTSQVFFVIDSNRVFTLPNMLTTIEPEAFAGTSAQLVIVPNGVQSIGSRAFADSSVIVAVIPDGVEVSGDAFPEGTFKFNGN